MKLLTLSQVRFLRFAPWSTLTVLVGVTLAVSSIVAVHQISQRVVISLDAIVPPYLQPITHLLEKPALDMDDYFDLRASWRAGQIPELVGLMPLVEGYAETGGQTVRLVGVDAFAGIPEIMGLGLLPPDQFISSAGSRYQKGDWLELNGRRYQIGFTHQAVPSGMLIADLGTVQAALGLSDERLSRVAIVVESRAGQLQRWSDRLLPGFSAGVMLSRWELPGWQVRTLESDLPSLGFARSVLFNLGALGTLALVVAWLLVYQVAVIWLRRRQQTLTRLRQMGVLERQLRAGFLLSLAAIGILASGLGIWIGDALASLLAQLVGSYAGDGMSAAPPVDRWVVVKAVGSAVTVCVVGGSIAYSRELRRSSTASGLRIAGLWVAVAGVALAGMSGVLLSDSLLGGFVGIASVGSLMLVAIAPGLGWLQKFSRHLRGALLQRVGLRELVWYPGDLAVAVGALALALATSVAIALMVDSFRSDFEQMLDRRMVHDLFVTGDGQDLSSLAIQLESLPAVKRVDRYGGQELVVNGVKVNLGYTRFDAAEAARYGLQRALEPGESLLSERLARSLGVSVGDRLSLGSGQLQVAAIFAGFGDPVGRLLVNEADAGQIGVALFFDRLSVDTTSPAEVIALIERVAPELDVQEQHLLRATALRIFDQTFSITQALTFLALIVASVGLYNALLALQLLQQRSHHLLHAMGVSQRELNIIGGWRIVGVGLAAIACAVPLGLVMGWLLCQVINPRAFGWSLNLQVTWQALFWPILSAAAVMLVTALIPTPQEGAFDEG